MQVKCIISHEETFPCGFGRYIAGEVYERKTYDPALFTPVAEGIEEVDANG